LLEKIGAPFWRTMIRFRLFGIPFAIAPYFWLCSALLGSNVAHGDHAIPLLLTWVACVLVSVIIHELGHALVARCFGVVPQVMLYGFGGLTRMQGPPLGRWKGILVTLAGPLAGIAFWGVAYLVWANVVLPQVVAIVAASYFLVFINLYWTLFNLLPVLPLDGGQVLRNLLGPKLVGVTRIISVLVAVAVCVYFAIQQEMYTAAFMVLLAFRNIAGTTVGAPQ
jgi:Zn-dependent protease